MSANSPRPRAPTASDSRATRAREAARVAPLRAGLLGALAFAACAALYAATAQSHHFSDGFKLAGMVQGGDHPYYNALYVPLGKALYRGIGLPLGWSASESLRLLSALCTAAAVGLLTAALVRRGVATGAALGWCALLALTPATWFFATTVEVHAVQLLGATLGALLALAARERGGSARLVLVAAACSIAVLAHLTSLMLVPALVLLGSGHGSRSEGDAGGAPRGRVDPVRRLPWAGLVGLALVALGTWLFLRAGRAFEMLGNFGRPFLSRFTEDKAYAPLEMLEYLRAELVVPSALLLAAALAVPIAALIAARARPPRPLRALLVATLVAALPYLIVLSAWGIRERGAYYTSLYPLFVLLAAESGAHLGERSAWIRRATPVVLLALAAGQGALAHRATLRFDRGPTAEEWARRAAELGGPGCFYLVDGLSRYWTAGGVGVGVADVRRDLELMPARRRGEQAMNTIGRAFAKAPTAVIVDADLLRDPDDAMLAAFRDALEALPVELVPVPAGSPDPALYRLVPRPSPDEPER